MLTITPNSLTLKKLTLVKQFFERAMKYSKSANPVNKIIAVILFDLANETTLNAIITSIDSSKTPSDGFPSLLNQTDDLLKKSSFNSLVDSDNILRVHGIRNDAQHDVRYPSDDDLNDCATYTRDFLKKIVQEIWNLDFEKIMLEDEIIDKPIRRVMKGSRDFISKGDLKSASAKMYEGLGAFKFMMFGYLTDRQISRQTLVIHNISVDLADILSTLAFKIMLGDDIRALRKLSQIKTNYDETGVGVRSEYPIPEFKDREEAEHEHEEILNIILTFQDKIPFEVWRQIDPNENSKPS